MAEIISFTIFILSYARDQTEITITKNAKNIIQIKAFSKNYSGTYNIKKRKKNAET